MLRLQEAILFFAVPFLSELKISWVFAAAPLHFQQQGWPLWAFGTTIGAATLCRVLMNALLTGCGDWLISPLLHLATLGAVAMLARPDSLIAVISGIAAGHITDTVQVQASFCYRLRMHDRPAQKRGLRLQAFSATFGYSLGAVVGGGMYEFGGFTSCATLQLAVLGAMALFTMVLPIVHTSFWEALHSSRGAAAGGADAVDASGTAEPDDAAAPAHSHDVEQAPTEETKATPAKELTLHSTTGCLLLPVSVVWLSGGFNIAAYITEWALFAVYFTDAYAWSSTLTGAAQMAGDLLAAGILALTTTPLWARLLRTDAATRHFDRFLLHPPWNLGIFFALYAATFSMLAQPVFAVSVLGQIIMGTIYVFNKQAVQESYVVLSHGSLPLYRKLEFVGSISFNVFMAAASVLSVLVYESVSMTAPFYIVAAVSGLWAVVVVVFFAVRLRGHFGESFVAAERALLEDLNRRRRGQGSATQLSHAAVSVDRVG